MAMAWRLRQKSVELRGWFPRGPVAKQLLSSVAMAGFAYLAMGFGNWQLGPASAANWAVLAFTVAGAAAIYAGLSWILGEPEVRNWLALFKGIAAAAGLAHGRGDRR